MAMRRLYRDLVGRPSREEGVRRSAVGSRRSPGQARESHGPRLKDEAPAPDRALYTAVRALTAGRGSAHCASGRGRAPADRIMAGAPCRGRAPASVAEAQVSSRLTRAVVIEVNGPLEPHARAARGHIAIATLLIVARSAP